MKGPSKLDEAIAKWRREMAAQGVKSRHVLDELENHLREEVAKQIRSGADPAEAFKIAVQRIGQGAVLRKEFAKLDTSKHQRLLRLFRATCFITGPFMLLVCGLALLNSDSVSVGEMAPLLMAFA